MTTDGIVLVLDEGELAWPNADGVRHGWLWERLGADGQASGVTPCGITVSGVPWQSLEKAGVDCMACIAATKWPT